MIRRHGVFSVLVGVASAFGILSCSLIARAQEPAAAPSASNPSSAAPGAAGSCKDSFDPKKFCEQLVRTQHKYRMDGDGGELDSDHCGSHTFAAMFVLQDQGKDLIKIQCEVKCNQNRERHMVRFGEVQSDFPWTGETDAFLRQHDACSPGSDYSKLIEAYQKQMGEDYTPN